MCEEQKNPLVKIVSQNTTLLQTSCGKFIIEIKDSSYRLNNIMKETNDLEISTEAYQNITDYKRRHRKSN